MARTSIQVLLNEPIVMTLGTKAKPVKVTISEPVNDDLGAIATVLDGALRQFLSDNMPLIQAAIAGGDVGKVPFSLSAISSVADDAIAVIIKKPASFVATMSLRQKVAVIEAFGEVTGWDFIKDRFLTATRSMKGLMQPSVKSAAPSWSQEPSPTSRARSTS